MLSEIATLTQIETELKKRWQFPYQWGRFQNNEFDQMSNYVYELLYFEDLLSETQRRFKDKNNYNQIFNYSLNRWYNFWSAKAIENIFASSEQVKLCENAKDKFVDFELKGIPFDHKSSIFPKSYPNSIEFALENPEDLIQWLYLHQSQENRLHFKNRIFIIFFDWYGEHWKLKAEITWLRAKIEGYLQNFKFEHLKKMYFPNEEHALSDILWALQLEKK